PPTPTPAPRTSTTAVISLIAGLLGFFQILPLIGPIIAVITGHMAKKEIRQSGGMVTGEGLATAGLILGYLSLGLALCAICVLVLMFTGLISLPFVIPTAEFSY
ncbi:MAG: DUF4190 domain-containing protein, partial [Anaerolineales bacterium]|nr:DUF4190 domain-containing protein [Anaerolineales bacterium]